MLLAACFYTVCSSTVTEYVLCACVTLLSDICQNRTVRKRILDTETAGPVRDLESGWRDLTDIATVEATSEDPDFPIESVFAPTPGQGWRASKPGEQVIRIVFDEAISIRRIQLQFDEPRFERTQQFTLRWSSKQGGMPKEIVRQQWNFSPSGSTRQLESYDVTLDDVSALELAIKPDVGDQKAVATLSLWRVS